jgi:hypothetical protein
VIYVALRLPDTVANEDWYVAFREKEELPDDWFTTWEQYRDRKKAEGGEPEPQVWARVKNYLFTLFHNKCGYCEANPRHVDFGAVDHYRPKSVYPGLMYEITNYVPACTRCNSGGKGAQFEVVGDLPLLLDPYDPSVESERHLYFHPVPSGKFAPGMVEGLTDRGKATVRICGLNRELLADIRWREQDRTEDDFTKEWKFLRELNRRTPGTVKDPFAEARRKVTSPDLPFSAARRDALDYFFSLFSAAA